MQRIIFQERKPSRKKGVWVSELDVCAVAPGILFSFKGFNVLQDKRFPSDHAPMPFTMVIQEST